MAQKSNNSKSFWLWLALLGGFVIIILLIYLLLYKQKTIQNSIENINNEINKLDIGDLDSDFQDVEKDINQL